MRFIHTSDWHLGKNVHEYSMLEEQRAILEQIENIVKERQADALVIAGDVYDRAVPPAEAVQALDAFLTRMQKRGVAVLMVSGNHDSPERLGFLGGVLDGQGLYIEGVFAGKARRVTLSDGKGPVHFYLLPYVKPAKAAPFFEGAQVESYEDAVRLSLAKSGVDPAQRNVLISHQLFTFAGQEAERCDSESVSIGGVENVDVSCLADFDYVALGHLHRAQRVGRETVRYAGSPLKYSFSEALGDKSVTLVEMGEKGEVNIERIPLTPLHDMREIRGPIDALVRAADGVSQDYIRAVLTDEGEVYDAMARLRRVYPHILRLDFEKRERPEDGEGVPSAAQAQTPQALFELFYAYASGLALTDVQREALDGAMKAAAGEEERA